MNRDRESVENRMERVRESRVLRSEYGDEIVLLDGSKESTVFSVLAEFAVGEQIYAVLQSDELRKEDEVEIFRVTAAESGGWELETIEDDEEWEHIAEIYDDMMFSKY